MGEFLSLLWKPSRMLPWSHLEVGMTTHVSENWWGNGKSEHLNQLFCCSCCWVAKSCPTLCDPMNCSTPASSVLHHLPEFAQIYVHWVADAIQSSPPLSSPSPPAFNLSRFRVFSNKSVLCISWPKYWSFSFGISTSNEYSGLIYRD